VLIKSREMTGKSQTLPVVDRGTLGKEGCRRQKTKYMYIGPIEFITVPLDVANMGILL
jgi:hypothetical protein